MLNWPLLVLLKNPELEVCIRGEMGVMAPWSPLLIMPYCCCEEVEWYWVEAEVAEGTLNDVVEKPVSQVRPVETAVDCCCCC